MQRNLVMQHGINHFSPIVTKRKEGVLDDEHGPPIVGALMESLAITNTFLPFTDVTSSITDANIEDHYATSFFLIINALCLSFLICTQDDKNELSSIKDSLSFTTKTSIMVSIVDIMVPQWIENDGIYIILHCIALFVGTLFGRFLIDMHRRWEAHRSPNHFRSTLHGSTATSGGADVDPPHGVGANAHTNADATHTQTQTPTQTVSTSTQTQTTLTSTHTQTHTQTQTFASMRLTQTQTQTFRVGV
ncbi:hypothetical protein L6452_41932 [Arctium lappa]|uniref:Uncharacterized protein n=1 Tax=Arctium lappa TaxID=4217 RepID=A0ACB8XHF7_ARCLA|nr:hypothetical protein L6452_41932 [Arctium lappa]